METGLRRCVMVGGPAGRRVGGVRRALVAGAAGAVAVLAGGAADASAEVTTVTVSTPSEGVVQVVGSDLADSVTIERVDGTRRVKIRADRTIKAPDDFRNACTITGRGTAECVAPPFVLNAIQPELGVVFGGFPVIVNASLQDGDDTLRFLRSAPGEDTRFRGFGGDGDDALSADGLRAGITGEGSRSGVILTGDRGDDVLTGGPGIDRLTGGDDNDELRGGNGDDVLNGSDGDDLIVGGEGDDTEFGGDGDDALLGQGGDDQLIGGFGGDSMAGGTGRDAVQYIEKTAKPNPNSLDPFDLIAVLVPRRGVTVAVGDGQCTDGGPEDVAVGPRAQLRVSGSTCGATGDGAQRDEVLGDVEVVIGTAAADTLIGGPASDTLDGQDGDDQLEGGTGPDSLLGGKGDDVLLLRDTALDLGAVCGAGTDRVLADDADPVNLDCEKVDRGAPALPPATGGTTLTPPAPQLGAITDGTSNTVVVGEDGSVNFINPSLAPITDGTSNTVLVGEAGGPRPGAVVPPVRDGTSNPVLIGENGPTAPAGEPLPPTDGASNTIVIGPTDGSGPFVPLPPAPAPPGQVATEVVIVVPGVNPTDAPLHLPVHVDAPAPAGSPPAGLHTGGPGPGGGDRGASPPEARLVSRVVSVDRRGRAKVLLTCLYRAKDCKGSVTIRATKTLRKGKRRVAKGGRLARANVTVPWGKTKSVTLKLGTSARAVVVGRRTTARLEAELRDSGVATGAKRRLSERVTLAGRR